MMNGKQCGISIIIDARYHTPFNLRTQAFCMLLKAFTKLCTLGYRAGVIGAAMLARE